MLWHSSGQSEMNGNSRRFILDTMRLYHFLKAINLWLIVFLRKSYKKIKIPDAIIISTATANNCTLITADKKLHKIDEVEILSFEDEIKEENNIEIETENQ